MIVTAIGCLPKSDLQFFSRSATLVVHWPSLQAAVRSVMSFQWELPCLCGKRSAFTMMPDLFITFIIATVALIVLPGPNVALIVANSVAYGRRFGLLTVAGTSVAMVLQLALTVLGMTGALTLMGHLFEWVRWAGVIYLIYLGVQALRASAIDLTKVQPQPRSARSIFLRGFMVSFTNPKTLLFYSAFFPQFVTPGAHLASQLALLSLTFLVVAATLDCCWALAAGRLRRLLATRGALRNRLTCGFYLAAALGLAGARKAV